MSPGVCGQCGGRAPVGLRTCGSECSREWADLHVWSSARVWALARGEYCCEQCGALDWDTIIEVHHIVPVEPVVGYRHGCQHHPDNLAVLCRVHHLAEHAALRAKPGTQLGLVLVA